MSYQNFLNLPLPIREALMFYYTLPELKFYDMKRNPEKMKGLITSEAYEEKEALKWGLRLTSSIYFMFSADSLTEYAEDCEKYLKIAESINKIYGDIVAVPDPGKTVSSMKSFGIKGHLKTQFSSISTITKINDSLIQFEENLTSQNFEQNTKYRSQQ